MRAVARAIVEASMEKSLEYEHRTPNLHSCAIPNCVLNKPHVCCPRCKKRFYCSEEHRKKDWDVHRRYCRMNILHQLPPRTELVPAVPTLSLETRTELTSMLVDNLLTKLQNRERICKAEEAVWGIFFQPKAPRVDYVGISYPIGMLMYRAWNSIYQDWEESEQGVEELRENLCEALLDGSLLAFFCNAATSLQSKCPYCAEMVLRDFQCIPWDLATHRLLSGDGWVSSKSPPSPTAACHVS